MIKIDPTTESVPPSRRGSEILSTSSSMAAQAVIEQSQAGVSSPSLVDRIVRQINSEEVTIGALFLLVVGVAAIFNPIVAVGIGFGLLAVYSACRVLKSEVPTTPAKEVQENQIQVMGDEIAKEIASLLGREIKKSFSTIDHRSISISGGEDVKQELQNLSIPKIVVADLIGRYSPKETIEIFKDGTSLFDSKTKKKSDIARAVVHFSNGGNEDREKKLRKLALILGTQSASNPCFDLGLGRGVVCAVGNFPGTPLYNLWNAIDRKTNVKVTLEEKGLHINELSFEIVVPKKFDGISFDPTRGEPQGIGELIIIKTVLRNIGFNVEDSDLITVEKLSNYSVEQTVTKGRDATTEDQEMIAAFCELAKISQESVQEALDAREQLPATPSSANILAPLQE